MMSGVEEQAAEEAGAGPGARVLAVEVGDSAALGADVRLELSPGTTVLVGRNGAGKSLLLEGIVSGCEEAIEGYRAPAPQVRRFACEVELHSPVASTPRRVRYEYWLHPRVANETRASSRSAASFDERCTLIGAQEELWRVDDGLLTDGRSPIVTSWGALSLLASHGPGNVFKVPEAVRLVELFENTSLVRAGIPRGGARQELTVPYSSPQPAFVFHPLPAGIFDRFTPPMVPADNRIRTLAHELTGWHEQERPLFDEFVGIGRRIGLLSDVRVKLYRDPDPAALGGRRDLVSVFWDDVNIGLLSDGTLHVAEIIASLIRPNLKLLLIEEPETAVHPGLLGKLLAEIEAYTGDRQVILSTQSPQVVSWAKPADLRLVERRAGKTSVRGLRDDEVARLSAYLHDEGTLGEFVYSGALDG